MIYRHLALQGVAFCPSAPSVHVLKAITHRQLQLLYMYLRISFLPSSGIGSHNCNPLNPDSVKKKIINFPFLIYKCTEYIHVCIQLYVHVVS